MRHRLGDRLFHWAMAACILVLCATAFLPILGVNFNWIPIHWWTGALLVLTILYHLYRVFAVHGIGNMVPDGDDAREGVRLVLNQDMDGLKPAKYDVLQKLFHLLAAATVVVTAITGIFMLAKIDTVFWNRDPSILTDQTWGIIYVLHGLGAMMLIFLIIVHVYFGLIPNHRAFLISMLQGQGPELARGGQSDN